MANEVLKTADEWLAEPAYKGIEVYDPDGWDRQNFTASWAERISEAEFNLRLVASTCRWPRDLLTRQ